MSDTQYDIFITGKLKPGVEPRTARDNLVKLFKISPEKAAHMISGKPQLIKKGLDKAAAQRYLKLLQQAGMETGARKSAAAEAAQKPAAQAPQTTASPGALELTPAGTPVLREEERHEFAPVDIDTTNIKLASAFTEPTESREEPPPMSVPDFGLAPPGSLIDNLPSDAEPLNPDISDMSLAEPGVELGEIKRAPPPPPPPTEHLQLENDS